MVNIAYPVIKEYSGMSHIHVAIIGFTLSSTIDRTARLISFSTENNQDQ